MDSNSFQPGILAPPSSVGASLTFRLATTANLAAALTHFAHGFSPSLGVVGLGEPLLRALGREVPGLRTFPGLSGPGHSIPSTQQALWIYLRGEERGNVFDSVRKIEALSDGLLAVEQSVETFLYSGGRDLTNYEDGTENPAGDAATAAAFVAEGDGLAGSSFVAVQRWVHSLAHFHGRSAEERDHVFGRRQATNEEIPDAPVAAHVKRSAQESFSPPAFMVRRSMPWATASEHGLEFVAFGASLDPFEQVMRRMLGLEDNTVDALFSFSRAVTGGYYWCPPVANGRLDLRMLGL